MIRLETITADNLDAVLKLKVSESQADFVSDTAHSMAVAYANYKTAFPFAVCADSAVVGFIMFGFYEERNQFTLWKFLIDKKYQNKGYGKAALLLGIEYMKKVHLITELYTGVSVANTAAEKLYQSVGFRFTGLIENGMKEMKYLCDSSKSKVLLTAFEGEKNSSGIILNKVSRDNVIKVFLPNEFDKSAELLISSIIEYRPGFVISMGRKPQIKRLYIEPSAHNNTDSITTTFDLDLLCESLAEHGIAFRKAGKQSSWLCNHVYYCGLDYIHNSKMQTKMVFIHTPDMNNFENIDGAVCWLNEFCGQLAL